LGAQEVVEGAELERESRPHMSTNTSFAFQELAADKAGMDSVDLKEVDREWAGKVEYSVFEV
jgi:hypothetical protein